MRARILASIFTILLVLAGCTPDHIQIPTETLIAQQPFEKTATEAPVPKSTLASLSACSCPQAKSCTGESSEVCTVDNSVCLPSAPPIRCNSQPSGVLSMGTYEVMLSLSTDRASECRYSSQEGKSYDEMPFTFETLLGIVHQAAISSLQDGGSYTYYVKCKSNGVTNIDDYPISFSISSIPEGSFYYVSTLGDDSNPGTKELPFRSIQKAADLAAPGDTVLVMGGTYYEQVVPQRSGTPDKYITYRAYGPEEVIINAQQKTRDACIYVIDTDYLRFYGFTLVGARNAGFLVRDGSDHIWIDQIKAENNRFGIRLYGLDAPVSNITVRNSIADGNAAHGIFLYKKVYNSVIGPNNHVYNNGSEDDDGYGIEIGTNSPGVQEDGARNIIVIDNEVNDNYIQGIRTWNAVSVLIKDNYSHHNGATGIQIENGSKDIIVEGNLSESNAQKYEYETGTWVDDSANVVVQDNKLMGNQIGLMVTFSSDVLLRNNIVADNNKAWPGTSNSMGLNINQDNKNIITVHNTIYRNGQVDSSKGNLSYCDDPTITGSVIKNNIVSDSIAGDDLWAGCAPDYSDYNNFYDERGVSIYWLGSKLDWSGYLSSSSLDAHSFTTKPLFTDPASGDFTLLPDSPDIDLGDFLARTTIAGTGMQVVVDDARFFSDGLGLEPGDSIIIGQNAPVRIAAVDLPNNTLSIDQSISWDTGDPVSYVYRGNAPDIGAIESR